MRRGTWLRTIWNRSWLRCQPLPIASPARRSMSKDVRHPGGARPCTSRKATCLDWQAVPLPAISWPLTHPIAALWIFHAEARVPGSIPGGRCARTPPPIGSGPPAIRLLPPEGDTTASRRVAPPIGCRPARDRARRVALNRRRPNSGRRSRPAVQGWMRRHNGHAATPSAMMNTKGPTKATTARRPATR
jgi:hypothetical protein